MNTTRMRRGNSVEDTAAKIGCSRAKAYNEIKAGRLQARKLGRLTIVLDEEIDRYLSELPVRVPEPEKQGKRNAA